MRLFSSIQARLLSALFPLPASITEGGNAMKRTGEDSNRSASAFEHLYDQNVLTAISDGLEVFKTQSICVFLLLSSFFSIHYRFSPSLAGILKLHKFRMSCFVSNSKISNWIYTHMGRMNANFLQNKLFTAKLHSRPA